MTFAQLHSQLRHRLPIDKIPINWDDTLYTSDHFNEEAESENFQEWKGDYPLQDEVRTITQLLQTQPGQKLFDIACGFGRHALPLAKDYELRVTGIDRSTGLIHRAQQQAQQQRLEVDFHLQDARDINAQAQYDHALIGFNTFSLFDPKAALPILQRIHRALRPRGRLFFDLDQRIFNNRYTERDTLWTAWNGGLVFGEYYYHSDTHIEVSRDLTFGLTSEAPKEYIQFKRIYGCDEIEELLAASGFSLKTICGDWDQSPLADTSPKMLIVGEKR